MLTRFLGAIERKHLLGSLYCCLAMFNACGPAAPQSGTYSGMFRWEGKLTILELNIQANAPDVHADNTELRSDMERIIRERVRMANLNRAQGTFNLSFTSPPMLVSLKEFAITVPNFSQLLQYVSLQDADEIQRFVKKFDDVNQRDLPNGRTALFYSAAGCRTKSVQTLLGISADPNIADFEGDTPIIAAITADCLEAGVALLHKGGNPNQVNNKGVSPLMRAVELQRSNWLRLLLRFKADVTYVPPSGESALSIARAKKDAEMVNVLQRAGAMN